MSQVIDTSTWVEFRVGDILDIKSSAKVLHRKDVPTEGKHPYVTRSQFNNGISGYVDSDVSYLNPENTISFAMDTYTLCYQDTPYFTGNKVKVISYDGINSMNAMFLISVMNKTFSVYNYVSGMDISTINNTIIQLPATSSGEPDWDYMAAYMDDIASEAEQALAKLELEASSQSEKIDISQWAEFKVGDLFEVTKRGKSKNVLTGASVPKSDLTESNSGVPRVSASGENNGIIGTYESTHKNYRVYSNFISVSFLGSVFYQPGDVSLEMKVHALKPIDRTLNVFDGLFLAAAIKSGLCNKFDFSYAVQISSSDLAEVMIHLPATPTGEPDWDYMDNYMQELMG